MQGKDRHCSACVYQVRQPCIGLTLPDVICAGVLIAFLACVTQGQLTQTSVEAFSRSLTGSVLAYNVSNEATPSQPPTFDLWSYLEVTTSRLTIFMQTSSASRAVAIYTSRSPELLSPQLVVRGLCRTGPTPMSDTLSQLSTYWLKV